MTHWLAYKFVFQTQYPSYYLAPSFEEQATQEKVAFSLYFVIYTPELLTISKFFLTESFDISVLFPTVKM